MRTVEDYCANNCGAKASVESNHYPCCGWECFDIYISHAKELKSCAIHKQILSLRDDAENRVANIERASWGNRLAPTKNYFQARADVLNDLLMIMDTCEDCSCR